MQTTGLLYPGEFVAVLGPSDQRTGLTEMCMHKPPP